MFRYCNSRPAAEGTENFVGVQGNRVETRGISREASFVSTSRVLYVCEAASFPSLARYKLGASHTEFRFLWQGKDSLQKAPLKDRVNLRNEYRSSEPDKLGFKSQLPQTWELYRPGIQFSHQKNRNYQILLPHCDIAEKAL